MDDGSCWLVSCPFIHLYWTKNARTKNINGNSKRNVLLLSMLKEKMNCLDKPIDFRFTDRFPVAQKHFTFLPYFMKSLYFFMILDIAVVLAVMSVLVWAYFPFFMAAHFHNFLFSFVSILIVLLKINLLSFRNAWKLTFLGIVCESNAINYVFGIILNHSTRKINDFYDIDGDAYAEWWCLFDARCLFPTHIDKRDRKMENW